ncbi:MAG TPA: GTP pyrophosphokinase [Lachnospiraceae bacterium]|nr:GTP pyrophosphokinase [Lachnospiraceae bacterium]
METESIYGDHLPELEAVKNRLLAEIDTLRKTVKDQYGMDPVEHCLARIKSEESMREKCRRRGLPETTESALVKIHDAVGIRVVTSFISDVYLVRDYLASLPGCRVVEEKDYIRHAKPNGYRSYHMILLVDNHVYAEIQLRTISQDTWASLEHHLKYKKTLNQDTNLIVQELKRCADELASTDVSMQTIRDAIFQIQKDKDR